MLVWYRLVLPLALTILFGPQMVDSIDATAVYKTDATNLVVKCSYSDFLDRPRGVHINCLLNRVPARGKLHQISPERVGELQLNGN